MSGWVPGLPGAPPTLLHTALPGGVAAFLASEQQRLIASGAGRGYGAPDPTGGRHVLGGYGAAPADGQVHPKVALLLHWLLAGGHITPDVALRALHYVAPFSLEASQLAALVQVAPPIRAPDLGAAPKPRPPPPTAVPRASAPPPEPPTGRGATLAGLHLAPVDDEHKASPAGEGKRPRRHKRARLDSDEFVTQHIGPGPVPGATNSAGTGPKGRLKWTSELKSAFDSAVESLGGLVHAQPAQILVTMRLANGGVPPSVTTADGQVIVLSLNHLKSFLQKKRLVAIHEGTLDPADIGAGRGITHVRRTSKNAARDAARKETEYEDGEGEEEEEEATHLFGENGAGGGKHRARGGGADHKATNGAHAPGFGVAAAGAGKHGASRPIPDSAARLLALLAATGPGDGGVAPHRFGPDEMANGHGM